MSEKPRKPNESKAKRTASAISRLRMLIGLEKQQERTIQQRLFTNEEIAYAEANPASNAKISELVNVIKTITSERDTTERSNTGFEHTVIPVYEEGSETVVTSFALSYFRAGKLEDAAIQQEVDTKVALVTGIDEGTINLEPRTIEGFGYADRPTFAYTHTALVVHETEDPLNPHRLVRQRIVRTVESQRFSEYLLEREQAEVTGEIPGTDRDIEHAIDLLTAAVQSNRP